MPEVPVPLDPAALKTLTIATSQVLPNALTQIMLGDILQFSVRSNPPDDLGVLFFRGNLIKANIPPEFEAGDRLTARVTQQGEQVLLKVVDVEKAANIAQQPSRVLENPAQSSLVAQLADIFRTAGVPLYTEPQILPAPINLEQAGQLSNEIKNLLDALGSTETFTEAKAVIERLNAASQGSLAIALRETSAALRSAITEHAPPPAERLLLALRQELAPMLAQPNSPAPSPAKVSVQLEQIAQHIFEQTGLDIRSPNTPLEPQQTVRLVQLLQQQVQQQQQPQPPQPDPAAALRDAPAAYPMLGQQILEVLTRASGISIAPDAARSEPPELGRLVQLLAQGLGLEMPGEESSSSRTAYLRVSYALAQTLGLEMPLLEPKSRSDQLARLVQVLEQELGPDKETVKKGAREILRQVLGDLHSAAASSEPPSGIQTAVNRIDDFIASAPALQAMFDPKTTAELQTLANRLEQLSHTLDALNQLNPLMRALGEPVMVLFPFILQGFLAHSEVTFQGEKAKKNKKNSKNEAELADDGSDKKGAGKSTYDRIHINVALPAMGGVGVDVAHRGNELLVRFTVGDPEACSFLSERLVELESCLNAQGFTLTSCTAAGTPPSDEFADIERETGLIA